MARGEAGPQSDLDLLVRWSDSASLLDHAALRRILDAAPRTLVLVDEAYFEFAGVTVLPWIRKRANLVVSRTLSKAAGLAALRLGVLFARSDIADALRRACTPYPVSNAALVAAEAALADRRFLRRYVREVLANYFAYLRLNGN